MVGLAAKSIPWVLGCARIAWLGGFGGSASALQGPGVRLGRVRSILGLLEKGIPELGSAGQADTGGNRGCKAFCDSPGWGKGDVRGGWTAGLREMEKCSRTEQ